MPTYDYRCNQCNHTFDKLVPLAERDSVNCPQCGNAPVQRLLTGGNYLKSQGCYSAKTCSPSGCGCGSACGH